MKRPVRSSLQGIEDGWLKIEETKPAPGFQAPEDPVTEVYVKGGENKTVTISNTPCRPWWSTNGTA